MTSDDSLYRAPESPLERPSQGGRQSLDDAIAGRFDFSIGAVMSEAWSLVDGSKGVILGGFAIVFGISAASEGLSYLGQSGDVGLLALVSFVFSLAANALIYAVNAGIFLYAIKRAAGDPAASFDDVISCFPQILPILGLTLLQGLLVVIGLVLLVIPGIYLGVAYSLALQLKVERGLAVWDALETSRKTVTNCWFQMALLILATGLIVGVGTVLSLGIGAIWLLPFGAMVFGVVYREIFGYASGAAASAGSL